MLEEQVDEGVQRPEDRDARRVEVEAELAQAGEVVRAQLQRSGNRRRVASLPCMPPSPLRIMTAIVNPSAFFLKRLGSFSRTR